MRNLFILFVLLINVGCGSEDDTFVPALTKIEVKSTVGSRIDLGESTMLVASGFDQRDQPYDISEEIEWITSNSNVNVDSEGTVTGLMVGTSIVTAKVGEVQGTFQLEVWDSTAPRTEIYVSDAGNFDNPPWQILKYDEEGNNPEVFIGSNLGWPQDIVFLEEKEWVIVSNLNNNSIAKFGISSGEFLGQFASGIGGPTRMKIGNDGLLYVLQWTGDGLVRRYDLDGNYIDNFTDVGISQSIGIAWDSQGNLYVSSFNNGSNGFVRKFDSQGNDMGLFINSNLQGPTDIWFNGNDLFVSDWSAGDIKRFDSNGDFKEIFVSGLIQPEGVSFLLNGNLLVGDGGRGAVKMYNSSGNLIEELVSSGTGGLMQPNAITVREVNR